MNTCKQCAGSLSASNKSGYCKTCVWTAPEMKERRLAGLRKAYRERPEIGEAARDRIVAATQTPEHAERGRRFMLEKQIWKKSKIGFHPGCERAKRIGQTLSNTRLSWCPPHLRADYLNLVNNKKFRAAEARELIEQQHEIELARFRRSLGQAPQSALSQMKCADSPVDAVIQAAALNYKVAPQDVVSLARSQILMPARCAAATAFRDIGFSTPVIARLMNRSDHTSAMHWIKLGKVKRGDALFEQAVSDATLAWRVAGKAAA